MDYKPKVDYKVNAKSSFCEVDILLHVKIKYRRLKSFMFSIINHLFEELFGFKEEQQSFKFKRK